MSKLKNRVISVNNRKTSMRLASEEWTAFDDICKCEHLKRKKLLELIEQKKGSDFGLTSSVRLFTITYMHNLIDFNELKNKADLNNKNLYRSFDMIS